ncbi:MAG: hypothetical protein WBG02_07635, partial [Candidatus Acidiferrum sp.]
VLGFLMAFLAVGLIFIAGAAAREGNLEPGERPSASRIRRARMVMVITAAVVIGILYLGKAWWGVEATNYKRDVNFFKPPEAETQMVNGNQLVIRAKGQDPAWSKRVDMNELIPDHNHLMHLFLISTPGMERMWHLHPERGEGGAFVDDLPDMPAGHYEVFADIVDRAGFPWTLVGTVDLPQIAGKPLTGDDSTWSGTALDGRVDDSNVAQLADGYRIVWDKGNEPLTANAAVVFKFRLEDKDGQPAKDMEPYMGMAGHAEFVSSDMSVFAHIHPAGSVSMAALQLASEDATVGAGEMQGGMSNGMTMAMAPSTIEPEVSFPYGFPKAGEYRIFVQVKRAGQIETGVFEAHVQ